MKIKGFTVFLIDSYFIEEERGGGMEGGEGKVPG